MNTPDISNKSFSVITYYYDQFKSSFRDLGKQISDSDSEKLAVEIVRAMGSELRDYHKPEHSLDVSKGQEAIPRLAAIFHDCVYVQVDPSFKTYYKNYFNHFIPSDDFKINPDEGFHKEKNPLKRAIVVLFGMETAKEITLGLGINELLSTFVMESLLSKHLTPKEVLSIAACIEATIPFRKPDADGNSSAARLKNRLNKAGALIQVEFSEEEKKQITEWCKSIVERDLSSFASRELNQFISTTWNVMSENNPPLRNAYFLASEYRKAVYGVIGFFNSIDPDQLFWDLNQQRDDPTQIMIENAKRNKIQGCEYLKVVGLSLSLLEAIALETGGELPYETLLGPTPKSREHNPISIDLFFEPKPLREFNSDENEVYELLKVGRGFRARFDRKTTPLGLYLYQYISRTTLEKLYLAATHFHQNQITALSFLTLFPKNELIEIIHAIRQVSLIRDTQMHALIQKLQ